MIKLFKYLFLVVCVSVLKLSAQTVFNKYFPSGSLSMGSAINRNADGNYLLSSYFVDSISGVQGLDLKIINEQGSLLNTKRYLMPGNMPFLAAYNNCFLHEVSNRSILITAASYSLNNSTAIFVSVDRATLDTNWVKYYSIPNYEFAFRSVTKINPNNFMFFGNKFSNTLNIPTRPYYITLDTLGNLLSIKEFNNYLGLSTAQAIYDSVSNCIYFAGQDYSNPNYPIGAFVCVDTAGNEIWKKTNYGQFGTTTMQLKNSYLHLAGTFLTEYEFNNSRYKLALMKLNAANGNLVWQKKYGESYAPNLLNALYVKENGDALAVGIYKSSAIPYSAATDGVLLKVNTLGDSLWMQTYGNFGIQVNEAFFDIEPCSDGGYMIIGVPHFAPAPNSQIWVVKTDSMGYAPGLTTSIESIENTGFSEVFLAPNPSSETCYIFLPNNVIASELNIRIYSSAGKDVTELFLIETQSNNSVKIKHHAISSGVYFLKLLDTNRKTIVKKLIISASN